MLSRNLLIASVIVSLVITVSTAPAPVEDIENEETEVETEEGEEELSEEEEDDDDSKSQDKNMGAAPQTSTASKGLGISALPDVSAQGQGLNVSSSTSSSQGINGGVGESPPGDGSLHDPSSLSQESVGAAEQPGSSLDSISGVEGPGSSSPQLQAPGTGEGHADITSHGADTPDTEYNGNGHKLLNGVPENGHSALGLDHFTDGASPMDSTAGALEPFGPDPHLDYTGIIDETSHDFLIGLMGGVDPYSPDIHIDTGVGLDPEADLALLSSSSSPHPDPHPGDHLDHPGQSGPDHSSPGSSPDHAVSGPDDLPAADAGMGDYIGHIDAPDAASVMSLADHSHIDHPDGGVDVSSPDSPDSNGNGRQSLVIDTHGGDHHVDDQIHITGIVEAPVLVDGVDDAQAVAPAPVLLEGVYSSGAPDAPGVDDVTVTSELMNSTESDLGLGHDVTGAGDVHNVVDHTEASVTGAPSNIFPQTDVVGVHMATDTATDTTDMATDKGTAAPQAAHDSSQPAGTEQSQLAVPEAEQYNTSGQGPEGAENVELEDTC